MVAENDPGTRDPGPSGTTPETLGNCLVNPYKKISV